MSVVSPNKVPTNGINDGIDPYAKSIDLDALIVGAGFGGLYSIYKLRKLGLRVKVFEAGKGVGGVWYWNMYPGARCDVEMPFYSLDIPEIWRTWNWSERFAGWEELQRYFAHVTKVLDLEKDIAFNTEVISAEYSDTTNRWTVKTRDGRTATCKYFVNCVGTSFKRNFPNFTNFKNYAGEVHHSSFWPSEGVDVKDQTVAIIGTGATGLQISQEWAKQAKELIVFIRTPNYTLPMYQRKLTPQEQTVAKGYYHVLFDHCKQTRSGLPYARPWNTCFDNTEEEREAYLEELWQRGGFNFGQGLWPDFLLDLKANDVVYQFWAKKARQRIKNPEKAEILAPLKAPHPIGTKRMSLEQDYYEMMDRDNVTLVDLKKVSIDQFEKDGLRTTDGKHWKFDKLALATGYDAITGGLKDMGIKDRNGTDLKDRWSQGIYTHLGVMVTEMPNMYMVYGPQSPAPFTNGPIFIELQCEWVARMIEFCEKESIRRIEPTKEAELGWRESILAVNDKTLFPLTNSWYNGGNVEGKRKEQQAYLQGIDKYRVSIDSALDKIRAAKGESTGEFIIEKDLTDAQKVGQTVGTL